MLDALKQLFENNMISEEIQESIQQAWDSKLNEARTELTQQALDHKQALLLAYDAGGHARGI